MPPVVSIVGRSGSGKTTLLERLIPALVARGVRVGTIKHNAHAHEFDAEDKDTWRHRKAGAAVVVLAGPTQVVAIRDVEPEPSPVEIAAREMPDVDLVLAEGYKSGNLPKVEVFREEAHDAALFAGDDDLVALVTDADVETAAPRLALDDADGLADLLVGRFLGRDG